MNGARTASPPTPFQAIALTALAIAINWLLFAFFYPSTGPAAALAVGTVLGFGGVGSLAAQRVAPPAEARIGFRGFAPRQLAWLLLLLPAALLTSELDNWIAPLWPAPPETPQQSQGIAAQLGVLGTLQWALFAVGVRPVVEEFFFRGVLLQGAASRLGTRHGLAWTTALFALARTTFGLGDPGRMLSLAAQALLEGGLFGLARLGSGSLLAAIGLHAAWAALGVGAVLARDRFPIPGFNAEGGHTPLVWLVPAAVATVLGVIGGLRALRSAPPIAPAAPPPAPPDAGDIEG